MTGKSTKLLIRRDWLALTPEAALDPAQHVIDAHHHLYDRPGARYLLPDYLADLTDCGHDLRASVAVQARSMLRADGPPEMRAVGETEFLNGVAAISASGNYGPARIGAGIVAYADLMLGDGVRPVLERQIAAAGGLTRDGGRLCGIRMPLAWDADAGLLNPAYPSTVDMVDATAFRAGFAHLAALGLSFDIWAYYPQLRRIARLAQDFPTVQFTLNHCGGLVRTGAHAETADLPKIWRTGIDAMAACPNVCVKLSGLGMDLSAFGLSALDRPAGSRYLETLWRPWMTYCATAFGADRCLWGSNLPVDMGSHSLGVGLNAVKRIFSSASPDERNAIFWRTAGRVYDLALPWTLAGTGEPTG